MAVNINAGGRRVAVSLEVYEKISAFREERSESLPVLLPLLPPQQREIWRDDIWLEESLTPLWKVAYRILAQAGRIVVAECRIYPAEPIALAPGEWSAAVLGDRATCPAGGLTTTDARKLKIGEVSKHTRAILTAVAKKPKRNPDEIGDLLATVAKKQKGTLPKVLDGSGMSGEDYFSEHGVFGSAGIRSARAKAGGGAKRGRKPVPVDDRILAKFAKFYLQRVAAGSHKAPLDTFEKFKKQFPDLTPSKTRMMIYSARQRGLLSRLPAQKDKRGQQGQQGGMLTAEALALLNPSLPGSPTKPLEKVSGNGRGTVPKRSR